MGSDNPPKDLVKQRQQSFKTRRTYWALQLRPSRANHVRWVNQEQSLPIAAEGQTKRRGAAHGVVDDGERAAVAFVASSVGCSLWRVGQRQAIELAIEDDEQALMKQGDVPAIA